MRLDAPCTLKHQTSRFFTSVLRQRLIVSRPPEGVEPTLESMEVSAAYDRMTLGIFWKIWGSCSTAVTGFQQLGTKDGSQKSCAANPLTLRLQAGLDNPMFDELRTEHFRSSFEAKIS